MNNTEFLRLNMFGCNKLLNLNKLHHRFSSSSLSYTTPALNSIYTPLDLFFDSNISESKVSGVDDEVSVCNLKIN